MTPSVIHVVAGRDYCLHIEFDNHEYGILNMKPYLDFGVFKLLKDPSVFTKVRVSFDTIAWNDGIDLDPQFVYEKTIKTASNNA
jgi:hypothetical protein